MQVSMLWNFNNSFMNKHIFWLFRRLLVHSWYYESYQFMDFYWTWLYDFGARCFFVFINAYVFVYYEVFCLLSCDVKIQHYLSEFSLPSFTESCFDAMVTQICVEVVHVQKFIVLIRCHVLPLACCLIFCGNMW